eukprot:CAMPEP_0113885012 /NCGR_PEP_ID=MMETSP0780_2-20120614/10639_1 /TAXON_ID=652834 /ORGANISM="Palpitomonas bilix" /LENGTH=232 /DNA_ID=CAMNT_0000872821 /DNA_START=186 /DNA_END=884 /DNA_ORIENTATION=- /assembly_acc=CAM_ASM_000599
MAEDLAEKTEKLHVDDEASTKEAAEDEFGLFAGKKKKKKKKKKIDEEALEEAAKEDENGEQDAKADDGSDYSYQELLQRVYGFLQDKNPDLVEGKRFKLKPPQVLREGTKKTVFVNFGEICGIMNRSVDQVQSFFLAELGTDGSNDVASGKFTLKGRYYPKQVESILKKYLNEYVQCQLCKSFDTSLTREASTRLYFINCNRCGASRSVSQVKAGYKSITRQDRKALKAQKM